MTLFFVLHYLHHILSNLANASFIIIAVNINTARGPNNGCFNWYLQYNRARPAVDEGGSTYIYMTYMYTYIYIL